MTPLTLRSEDFGEPGDWASVQKAVAIGAEYDGPVTILVAAGTYQLPAGGVDSRTFPDNVVIQGGTFG